VPGQSTKVDYEYERVGVAGVFMVFEPLVGRREMFVVWARAALGFVHALKYVWGVMYSSVDRIVLVTRIMSRKYVMQL